MVGDADSPATAEDRANAKLIAAAPDLRAAVTDLVALLEGNSGVGANFWEQDYRYVIAKKALRKAEGRK